MPVDLLFKSLGGRPAGTTEAITHGKIVAIRIGICLARAILGAFHLLAISLMKVVEEKLDEQNFRGLRETKINHLSDDN